MLEAGHDQSEEDLVFVETVKAAVLLLTTALRSAPAPLPAPVRLPTAPFLEPAAAAASGSASSPDTEGTLLPGPGSVTLCFDVHNCLQA